jgi:hypothetical protein
VRLLDPVRIRTPALTLGGPEEGWTRDLAETELQNVLADVRRGIWRDEADVVEVGTGASVSPTFGDFAARWLASREAEPIRERTKEHHRWAVGHLTNWLGRMRVDEISPGEVDAFKLGKLAEGQLGANSVNRCVRELEYVLDYAVDVRLIETNPASGKRRRMKGTRPRQTFDYPEQLPALLRAAKDRYGGRGRPMIALLAGAGLRISEALGFNGVTLPRPRRADREGEQDRSRGAGGRPDSGSGRGVDRVEG